MKLAFRLLIALLLAAHAGSVVTREARAAEQPSGTTDNVRSFGPEPRRVLALYWYPSDHPVSDTFDRQFHAALKRRTGGDIEYYAEYFESARFPGESQARIMRDYLRQKYSDRRIDVLLAWGGMPLEFLLTYRNDLFPGTPIVYYVGTLEAVKHFAETALTGVLNPDAYERTFELALRLHPDTTDAFIISGTPARDRLVEREVSQQLEKYRGRIALTYLTDLPLDELIAAVKNLPRQSIILFARQSLENPDSILVPADFLNLISRSAPVPVYCPWSSLAGYGSVGGFVEDREAGATKAAEIVLRVARGARPQDIPIERVPQIATFDARQLTRWGISEDRLPPGSRILFREPTAWDQYKGYVIGSAIVLFVQTALILGLLAQRQKRRRTEALLKKSEQRYELATAAGLVGVWDWSLDPDSGHVDTALARAIGFAGDELDNCRGAWLARVHPDDVPRIMTEVQAHIEGRTPFCEVEYRMLHDDGSILWFLARGSVVRLPDGRAARMIGTTTDITERKRAEARLNDAQEELARVSRLTALGEFAASIAHEVSQPLSAILMNSRACLRWMASPAPPMDEIRAALLEIADAGNLAKEQMQRNRELFQHHTVEKRQLNINSVVRDVAAMARSRLQHSRVRLETTLDEDLPVVFGDRVELQQVLLNLLVNGIDAMETVDPPSRQIQIDSRLTDGGAVQITVRDTGIGLEDVDVDRMFMPTYTTKPAGTGVGLAICRSIVEAHGGRLWAELADGPGASFRFTVPAAITGTIEARASEDARLYP